MSRSSSTNANGVIYRDAYRVIYRRDPFLIVYDLETRRKRFFTDIRDVVRLLNECGQ